MEKQNDGLYETVKKMISELSNDQKFTIGLDSIRKAAKETDDLGTGISAKLKTVKDKETLLEVMRGAEKEELLDFLYKLLEKTMGKVPPPLGIALEKLPLNVILKTFSSSFDVSSQSEKTCNNIDMDDEEFLVKRKKILPDLGPEEKLRFSPRDFKTTISRDYSGSIESEEDIRKAFQEMSLKIALVHLQNMFVNAGLNVDRKELQNRLSKREDCASLFLSVFEVFENPSSDSNSHDVEEVSTSKSFASESKSAVKNGTLLSQEKSIDVSLDCMQKIVDNGMEFSPNFDFDVAENVHVYEGMPIEVTNHFYITIPAGSVFWGMVALADMNNVIVAVGKITEDERPESDGGGRALHFVSTYVNHEEMKGKRKFSIILFPADQEKSLIKAVIEGSTESKVKYIKRECVVISGELPKSEETLCIDFGTSNTTAGFHDGKEIRLVQFRDVTAKDSRYWDLLPTIVYVESVTEDNIVYKFGYEAKKELMDSGYDTEASIFQEIKRWVNSVECIETVYDKNGNEKNVKRGEIIKAYLDYVIRTAQQYFHKRFRKLHFSAPVKLKSVFLNYINEIYGGEGEGYDVVSEEESLDEGVAVVYHYITERLKEENDNTQDVLILDCGGGTTDLASCHYEYKKIESSDSGKLNITTDFVNGESNYGGNNITYRILQILKIKIASRLYGEDKVAMQSFIKQDENDMMNEIDAAAQKDGATTALDDIYRIFEERYKKAEEIIPTRFADCKMRGERKKTRRNFYYLWQLAELIKVEFFRLNLVNLDMRDEEDRCICVPDEAVKTDYYLNIKRNNEFEKKDNPMEGIEITIKEIERVISPDIYVLLRTLLSEFRPESLLKYKYRLSGQSCKITLFHDLLKEFTPGNRIRHTKTLEGTKNDKTSEGTKTDSSILKKFCIKGSIEYIHDREKGHIRPEIHRRRMRQLYSVSVEDDWQKKVENILLGREDIKDDNLERRQTTVEMYKRPANTDRVDFKVKDTNKKVRREIAYNIIKREKEECEGIDGVIKYIKKYTILTEEMSEVVKAKLIELSEDNIKENGGRLFCFFALPSRKGYGFRIIQICVAIGNSGKVYRLPREQEDSVKEPQFESYEDDSLETFFDGKR